MVVTVAYELQDTHSHPFSSWEAFTCHLQGPGKASTSHAATACNGKEKQYALHYRSISIFLYYHFIM